MPLSKTDMFFAKIIFTIATASFRQGLCICVNQKPPYLISLFLKQLAIWFWSNNFFYLTASHRDALLILKKLRLCRKLFKSLFLLKRCNISLRNETYKEEDATSWALEVEFLLAIYWYKYCIYSKPFITILTLGIFLFSGILYWRR